MEVIMRSRHALAAVLSVSGLLVFSLLLHSAQLAGQTGNPSKDQIARGEYLIAAGTCSDCHTPKTFTPKGPVPDMSRSLSGAPADIKIPPIPAGVISPAGWGALGTNDMTAWAGPWGVSFAANLTPDKATGIGAWTEAAFVKSLRTGKHKGVLRDILPPMPWQGLAKLTDDDLKAMFAYLQSLKPIQNKVPDPIPPKR
jgi:mono/diheme cytochrome c family protein